jgi:hypothetical protein
VADGELRKLVPEGRRQRQHAVEPAVADQRCAARAAVHGAERVAFAALRHSHAAAKPAAVAREAEEGRLEEIVAVASHDEASLDEAISSGMVCRCVRVHGINLF